MELCNSTCSSSKIIFHLRIGRCRFNRHFKCEYDWKKKKDIVVSSISFFLFDCQQNFKIGLSQKKGRHQFFYQQDETHRTSQWKKNSNNMAIPIDRLLLFFSSVYLTVLWLLSKRWEQHLHLDCSLLRVDVGDEVMWSMLINFE